MKKELDFTTGRIGEKILKFSLPLLIGNLLQQCYFVADTVVVGRLIGKEALAAISSGTVITTMLVYLFQGIATGAGIIISHFIGAKKYHSIKDTIKAATLFTAVAGGVMSILCFTFVSNILEWISVPEEVFKDTKLYLSIALLGILPMLLYNMGSNIIQSMGDAKTPLYYLGGACVTNVVLDVIFVKVFDMGVEGTAIATVITLVIASICIAFEVLKKIGKFKSKIRDENESFEIKSEDNIRRLFFKIIKIGVPIGIQSIVINLSNIVVQNHINGIGTEASAAWGIFGRLDTFIIMPFLSIRLAITTFVGQNYGAGKSERIFRGVNTGVILCFVVTGAFSFFACIFSAQIVSVFTSDMGIVSMAIDMVLHMLPFYVIMATGSCYTGAISGTGNSSIPMVINIVCMCVIRIALIPVFTKIIGHNMTSLYYMYLISWILTATVTASYYFFVTKKRLKAIGNML